MIPRMPGTRSCFEWPGDEAETSLYLSYSVLVLSYHGILLLLDQHSLKEPIPADGGPRPFRKQIEQGTCYFAIRFLLIYLRSIVITSIAIVGLKDIESRIWIQIGFGGRQDLWSGTCLGQVHFGNGWCTVLGAQFLITQRQ